MERSVLAPATVPLWEVEWRVVDSAAVQFGLDRATLTTASRFFEEIPIDSLDLIEFVMELEAAFAVRLPDRVLERVFSSPERATPRRFAAVIAERMAAPSEPAPRRWPARRVAGRPPEQ